MVLTADPIGGPAPLTVRFGGRAFDADGEPLQVTYDFGANSGEGQVMFTTTLTTSHVFPEPGYFNVRVRVSDRVATVESAVDIRVHPSDTVVATLAPSGLFGRAPVTVPLTAAGSSGGSGPIQRYEWYFDEGLFTDNMERGPLGWTAQSPWALTREIATSGNFSWSDSPDGSYADNADVSLVSTPFSLPPAPDFAELTFFQMVATGDDGDLCRVEVSTDGGVSFEPLPSQFSPGQPAVFSGQLQQFETLSLESQAGKSDVRVRFRLTSNGSRTADGWHLDDVRVHLKQPRPLGPPDATTANSGIGVTYDLPGLYRPSVRVVNSHAQTATESTIVAVQEREFRQVSLRMIEAQDRPPYRVLFLATAGSGGTRERPLEMSLDFDSDGVFDYSTVSEANQRSVYFPYGTPGPRRATLRVTDFSGNSASTFVDFTLPARGPSVTLRQEPIEGRVPLRVELVPSVESTEPVTFFAWSFDDGGPSYSGTGMPSTTSYVYRLDYDRCPTLLVRDRAGNEASSRSCFRLTGGDVPKATLTPSVTTGRHPIDIVFTTTVEPASGPNSQIVRYEYDFDGDGAVDRSVTTPAAQSFRYTRSGYIYPRVRVVDAAGRASAHRAKLVLGARPVSLPSAFPLSGTAPLLVEFSAFGASPGGGVRLHEWDFDGDGSIDLADPRGQFAVHTYHEPGEYRVLYRATRLTGQVGLGFITVNVAPGLSSRRSPEAFDPTLGQASFIRTFLSRPASITVRILDRARRPVRRLVDDAARPAGLSADAWDGKDDSGRIVAPGVYFYVLDYVAGNVRWTDDKTLITDSGVRPESKDPEYELTFDPAQGQLLRARYQLDRSYEVTMGIVTVRGILERMLLLREPQPAGNYIVVWDGQLDDGTFAEDRPNEFFYTPYYANPLPDNAMIVLGRPVLSDVSAEPAEFTPINPYDPAGSPAVQLRFLLSKVSTVTAQLVGPGGQVLRTLTRAGVPAGRASIEWDGRDQNGLLAQPGTYRARLRAVDSSGNRSLEQPAAVRIYY